MFPIITIDETTTSSATDGTQNPLFDFDTKKIVTKDGKVVMCTEKQLIQQWIKILIITAFEKYKIYENTGFGLSKLYSMRGHQILTSSYGISEIKRELQEKIEAHEKINSVKNITVANSFDTLTITCTVTWNEAEITSEVSV